MKLRNCVVTLELPLKEIGIMLLVSARLRGSESSFKFSTFCEKRMCRLGVP